MELDDDTIPMAAPSATAVEEDGATVLLDSTTGAVHVLNDVGAAIWCRLDGVRSVSSITAEICELYGAEPEGVAPDVAQFLGRLTSLGLLTSAAGTVGGEPVVSPREPLPQTREPLRDAPDGLSSIIDTVWVDWYTAQVVAALRAHGIESILLKGPAISRWLYQDAPSARGYLDADLLVATRALSAAATVLSGLGFEREDGHGMEPINLWATSWRRPADGAVVDLHRTLHGCEYSTVDPWPILRRTAVEEQIAGVSALVPSTAARLVEIVLISPADRPWRKWDDLQRSLDQLPAQTWREAAEVAKALGVERLFGYRLSQSPAGAARGERLGIVTAPQWWLRWEADPMLRWVVLFAALPSWRARLRLARQLLLPPASYVRFRDPDAARRGLTGSYFAWAVHVLRLVPGAGVTLLRSIHRRWLRD